MMDTPDNLRRAAFDGEVIDVEFAVASIRRTWRRSRRSGSSSARPKKWSRADGGSWSATPTSREGEISATLDRAGLPSSR